MKELTKLLLICIVLTIILSIVFNKSQTNTSENFNEYKLITTSNKLTDGYYIITNRPDGINEKCLMSDDKANPYLYQNSDRLCGYTNLQSLIDEGKAIWYIKNVKDDIFLIASGYDDLNKCLIFGNNGKNTYPSKFSWGYSNQNMCGVTDGIDSFNNSIGRALFKISNISNNKYTIINTSSINDNNVESIWPNFGSPSEATSSTLISDDINSMSPYYINRSKIIPQPYCLGIDDNKPQRMVSYDNINNKNACGFNSFNELVNDSRMVWNFYKITK